VIQRDSRPRRRPSPAADDRLEAGDVVHGRVVAQFVDERTQLGHPDVEEEHPRSELRVLVEEVLDRVLDVAQGDEECRRTYDPGQHRARVEGRFYMYAVCSG
jgi:hypothetical protein